MVAKNEMGAVDVRMMISQTTTKIAVAEDMVFTEVPATLATATVPAATVPSALPLPTTTLRAAAMPTATMPTPVPTAVCGEIATGKGTQEQGRAKHHRSRCSFQRLCKYSNGLYFHAGPSRHLQVPCTRVRIIKHGVSEWTDMSVNILLELVFCLE